VQQLLWLGITVWAFLSFTAYLAPSFVYHHFCTWTQMHALLAAFKGDIFFEESLLLADAAYLHAFATFGQGFNYLY
jgi:hypothetical protein